MQNITENHITAAQRRVLALHDLSCVGRSSLVPIISSLSAMGHQCVPVPTAVFSTHTAIEGWTCADLTDALEPTLGHFSALGLTFDAIYSGFLGTAAQIDRVASAARLKAADGLFLVDPVMGDNGLIYKTYTPEMTARMGELCALADVITPNVTEAALLLGRAPDEFPHNAAEAADWCAALCAKFKVRVVLTGLSFAEDRVTVACCAGGETALVQHERIPIYFPGTGDLFASVLLGSLLRGETLTASAARAGSFVRDAIAFTAARGTDPMYGVQFEPLLYKLTEQEEPTVNNDTLPADAPQNPAPQQAPAEQEPLQEIIAYYAARGAAREQAALVSLLREAQEACGGVLTKATLTAVADGLNVKPSYIKAVIKHVSGLRTEGARHRLTVCGGSSCRSKDSADLRRHIEHVYGVKDGGTSAQGAFTYQVGGCMKKCRKGPCIRWDGELYTHATPDLIDRLVSEP